MEENLGGAVGCVADGRTYILCFFCTGMQVKPPPFVSNITLSPLLPNSKYTRNLCALPFTVDTLDFLLEEIKTRITVFQFSPSSPILIYFDSMRFTEHTAL